MFTNVIIRVFFLVCFKGACINLFEVLCPVSLSCGGPDSDRSLRAYNLLEIMVGNINYATGVGYYFDALLCCASFIAVIKRGYLQQAHSTFCYCWPHDF